MTRTANARLAGFTYLFYIATALPAMLLFERAAAGDRVAARLASIAEHAADMRLIAMLLLLDCVVAFALGVALYGITRDHDHELAVLALCCRVGEGVVAAIPVLATLGLLWLATAAGSGGTDAAAIDTLGALLLKTRSWATTVAATLFAVGSTLFCYLLLRARAIPVPLAWLGLIASVLCVICFPAQLAGYLLGQAGLLMGLPMLGFELVLGLWLLIKGVAPSTARTA